MLMVRSRDIFLEEVMPVKYPLLPSYRQFIYEEYNVKLKSVEYGDEEGSSQDSEDES